ncbi:MAG TPA: MMPL family transporter [Solirubrobacteraceae bacterium]|nr:MMPL family transporter [Solirubrobacteraceae bacterium]
MLSLSRRLRQLVARAVGRPVAVVAVAALAAVIGGVLALGLRPSADTSNLVDRGSVTFQDTARFHQRFGDDAVLILAREDLLYLLLTSDLGRLLGLEGCLSGNAPPGAQPPGGPRGPCAGLAREKPARVVYGPGTFINQAAQEIAGAFTTQQRQEIVRERRAMAAARGLARARGFSHAAQERLANQAQTLVRAQYLRNTLGLALVYGIRSVPRIDDPAFVSRLVFDTRRGPTTPKTRFAYLLPNSRSALIQVRLRPELSEAERAHAIQLIRAATRMPQFRLTHRGTYTVTGAPVVVSDLTTSISHSIVTMLIVALVVMALTLALVFRSRPRLLPLLLALAAVGVLFGGMALVGASLTMASIAVLPILVGLGVDYAIQLQSRFDEVAQDDHTPASAAAVRAAGVGGPVIATACGATAAGFLVLLLSPVPMVRGFGLLLVIGVVLSFACALTAGFAALTLMRGPEEDRWAGSPRLRAAAEAVARAGRGAGDILGGAWRNVARRVSAARRAAATRAVGDAWRGAREVSLEAWHGALSEARRRPARVLGIGVALAVLGFALDTQTKVVSDVTRLVPADLPGLRDLRTVQRTTAVSGEIDVMVAARDLTDPRVINWMTAYQRSVLRRYGYSSSRGCGRAELCPALSLPDLFTPSGARDQRGIRALLDAVPPYFSQAVISSDRRLATMAFGIRLMPLDRQQEIIQQMRRQLRPPPGVQASLVGLPVLAADANAKIASPWRRLLTVLASLALVTLVLLAAYRRPGWALVPLIPIALAGGWSALLLFLMRIPLNPMSVTLGALVIAISTEFSVLLADRYRQERAAGHHPEAALDRTYGSTGRAVMASGVTAIAGFAVLIFSSIRMLREFGVVAVVDMVVSLLGVMIVLPAVLLLDERGELGQLPARAWRSAVTSLGRMRRPRAAGHAGRPAA